MALYKQSLGMQLEIDPIMPEFLCELAVFCLDYVFPHPSLIYMTVMGIQVWWFILFCLIQARYCYVLKFSGFFIPTNVPILKRFYLILVWETNLSVYLIPISNVLFYILCYSIIPQICCWFMSSKTKGFKVHCTRF